MTDQKNGTPQVRQGAGLEHGEMLEIFSKDSLYVTHFYITPMGPNVRLAAVERCPEVQDVMKCKTAMVMTISALLALGDLITHVKTQMIERQKPTTIDSDKEDGQKWG